MSYLGAILVNYALRQTATPSPPDNYLALLTSAGEVVGDGYGRVNVNGVFSAPDALDTTTNISRIDFPTPLSPWGQVTNVAIYDAATGGNLLLGGPLATPINVPASTPVYWNAGTLRLEIVVKQQ
jgi:hypothetical protein